MGDTVSADKQRTGDIAVQAARRALGEHADIGAPRKLAGGAMHESWALHAKADGATRQLVVRLSPAGRSDYDKTRREFEVLRVAFARGVGCPQPIDLGR